MDSIDKVSEDSLKRVGWIAAVAALTLANATAETAYRLTSLTASKGIARIESTAQEATEELFKKKEDPKLARKPAELATELAKTAQHYRDKLEHAIWREKQAVKSVKRLGESLELEVRTNALSRELARHAEQKLAKINEVLSFIAKASTLKIPASAKETKAEIKLKKLVPKRLFKGTLDFEMLRKALGEKEYEWYQEINEKDPKFGNKAAEFINFMNGKHTAYEILKAVSAEYTATDPEHALKLLLDLEKANLITLR